MVSGHSAASALRSVGFGLGVERIRSARVSLRKRFLCFVLFDISGSPAVDGERIDTKTHTHSSQASFMVFAFFNISNSLSSLCASSSSLSSCFWLMVFTATRGRPEASNRCRDEKLLRARTLSSRPLRQWGRALLSDFSKARLPSMLLGFIVALGATRRRSLDTSLRRPAQPELVVLDLDDCVWSPEMVIVF